MISEFQDLSDKIDRLAELTVSLRRENAGLRQLNAVLRTEKQGLTDLLSESMRRLSALLEKIPAPDAADTTDADDEAMQ